MDTEITTTSMTYGETIAAAKAMELFEEGRLYTSEGDKCKRKARKTLEPLLSKYGRIDIPEGSVYFDTEVEGEVLDREAIEEQYAKWGKPVPMKPKKAPLKIITNR